MEEEVLQQGRSLAETPTYSVASVVTVMVFVCFLVERSIYRFGKWLKKTRRKALFASLEKIKEELMLLGLISLLLAQSARWISEICVNSSLFSSQFYICAEQDLGMNEKVMTESSSPFPDETFLILQLAALDLYHSLHLCEHSWSEYILLALIYPCNCTKLQHVVSTLALEIREQTGPSARTQVKPRDGLFWFKKPDILLWLIQFVIFQNAFEMATFIWTLWGFKERSCFMRNHYMIIIRLTSGLFVQFWCSYMTVPLNVIVSQMGSQCKKALVTESVRESLHSWCKRVKQKSKHESVHSHTARSVCSLESTIDERDEITVVSGTLTRTTSLDLESLNQITVTSVDQLNFVTSNSNNPRDSTKVAEYLSESVHINPPYNGEDRVGNEEEAKVETLFDLFQKT